MERLLPVSEQPNSQGTGYKPWNYVSAENFLVK